MKHNPLGSHVSDGHDASCADPQAWDVSHGSGQDRLDGVIRAGIVQHADVDSRPDRYPALGRDRQRGGSLVRRGAFRRPAAPPGLHPCGRAGQSAGGGRGGDAPPRQRVQPDQRIPGGRQRRVAHLGRRARGRRRGGPAGHRPDRPFTCPCSEPIGPLSGHWRTAPSKRR